MRTLRTLPTLLGLLPLALAACGGRRSDVVAPPPDDARQREVESVFALALRDERIHARLADLCRTAPKRLSGSEDAARAVRWAEAALRDAGLENVRLEPCVVPRWERGDAESLTLVAPAPGGAPLTVCALGGSVGTPPEGVEAELMAVRSFDELRARAQEARGKFVLFDRPMDGCLADPFAAYGGAVDQRGAGAIQAARVGAVAALVRSMTNAGDDLPHTGAMRYEEALAQVPAAAVGARTADRLGGLLAAGERVRLRLVLSCRTLEDVESANVVGEIVGRERPEEVVLVGGHLDAWDLGEGAHDDGAGCVQTLEALRLLKELGLTPRRTLRVCLFMNEENGLRGGLAYRDAHAGELARHVLALESDRGGFLPRGFGAEAPPEILARLAAHAARLAPWGAGTFWPRGGGADISPLKPFGVVLCGYVPDAARYFDLHHTSADRIETVHPRELALGAAAIAAFAWCVADDPAAWR